jgi:hypothetical protein
MKVLNLFWLLITSASALTVERSLPYDGWFSVNASHIPSAEPIAALHLRIYLKSTAMISALGLEPGALSVWSQVPPEVKREGQVIDIIALAPNHTSLSTTSPLSIFKLSVHLGNTLTTTPIDSIRVVEALDTKAKPLSLSLKIEDFISAIKPISENLQAITVRQMDRIHEIDFFLSKPLAVKGQVLDARGRVLQVLENRMMPTGRHRLRWDGRDGAKALVPQGNYILELKIGPNTYHKQVSHVL